MIALALALLAPPSSGNPRRPRAGPDPLDGVAVQAESVVTFAKLRRAIKRVREEAPAGGREEEERMRAEILIGLWDLRIEEQAGSDLGVDPAQIERMSRAGLAEERGGPACRPTSPICGCKGKDAFSEESSRQRTSGAISGSARRSACPTARSAPPATWTSVRARLRALYGRTRTAWRPRPCSCGS
jgi:hypothetical protein